MSQESLLKAILSICIIGFLLLIIPLISLVIIIENFLGKIDLKNVDWFQLGQGITSNITTGITSKIATLRKEK